MGPRPEYPRPSFRRAEWESLNGEWEFGAGAEPVFDRTILVPQTVSQTVSVSLNCSP